MEKNHTNAIEMKGGLCESIAYYVRKRQHISTVNLLNFSYAYRSTSSCLGLLPLSNYIHKSRIMPSRFILVEEAIEVVILLLALHHGTGSFGQSITSGINKHLPTTQLQPLPPGPASFGVLPPASTQFCRAADGQGEAGGASQQVGDMQVITVVQ